jgi:hypothetical protein
MRVHQRVSSGATCRYFMWYSCAVEVAQPCRLGYALCMRQWGHRGPLNLPIWSHATSHHPAVHAHAARGLAFAKALALLFVELQEMGAPLLAHHIRALGNQGRGCTPTQRLPTPALLPLLVSLPAGPPLQVRSFGRQGQLVVVIYGAFVTLCG